MYRCVKAIKNVAKKRKQIHTLTTLFSRLIGLGLLSTSKVNVSYGPTNVEYVQDMQRLGRFINKNFGIVYMRFWV